MNVCAGSARRERVGVAGTISPQTACPLCSSDIDEDGSTNGTDLAIILAHWGSTAPKGYPRADTNADGTINGFDLAVILDGWGTCP